MNNFCYKIVFFFLSYSIDFICFISTQSKFHFLYCRTGLGTKKWRGLTVKRSEPQAREAKTYIEGKLRKKSSFSNFKSECLGKEGKWPCCLFNVLLGL